MEENNIVQTEQSTQDHGMSPIKESEKKQWWTIAFIWIGGMICIPMLMVGGIFGGVLTMGSIFWATLIGFSVCCLLMVLSFFDHCDGACGSLSSVSGTHLSASGEK